MNRTPWQMAFTVIALVAAGTLLTGCPKKPATGSAGAGAGAGAGGSSASGSGPGGAGGLGGAGGTSPGTMGSGPGGTMGSGPGGAGGVGGAGSAGGGAGTMAGGSAATGTTIPALPSPKEFVETSSLRDVHFDFDQYDIRTQDAPILEDNARWLQDNPNALVMVEGHADERGTNEYNLALGERRAKATRDFLVSLGVDSGRVTVISYGEERPLCTERTEACWAQNRRAHFLVKQ